MKSSDGSSVLTRDYGNWLKRPGLKEFISESLASFMVCTLMEAKVGVGAGVGVWGGVAGWEGEGKRVGRGR